MLLILGNQNGNPGFTRAWPFRRNVAQWVAAVLLSVTALPVYAANLVVDTASDVVDGDVSSPSALLANPGRDGRISLREAIVATNNAAGPHRIGFADELAGQTIALTSPLDVTRDGVTLTGLVGPDGQPAIALDGRGITVDTCRHVTLFIQASDFTMTRLKFTGVTNVGIVILAGHSSCPSSGPSEVRNILVEYNVFDNSSVPGGEAAAIRVWTDPTGVSATIGNVRIAHNTFRHYVGADGSGIIVNSVGTNCVIRDVVIESNAFEDVRNQVELACSITGTNNRLVGSRIISNTFTNSVVPVFIGALGQDRWPPTADNVIDDTIVRGNVFLGDYDSVDVVGGQSDGTLTNAIRNVVRNTQILDNLIVAGRGIVVTGGGGGGALNRVEGVQVVNNTIVTHPLAGLRVDSNRDINVGNRPDGTANSVAGVSALNTILWKRLPDAPRPEDVIAGDVRRDQVAYSITSRDFAGSNGNIADDPRFVDAGRGNYHLQPGSPVIDAGSSEGAPDRDLEGRKRVDDPATPNRGGGAIPYYDMGAFEFGGTPGVDPPGAPSSLTVSSAGSSVSLTWQASTSGGPAAAYIIEGASGPRLADLATFSTGSTVTSFSVVGVYAGGYYLRVRATNAAGTSAPSNEVFLVVGGCASPPTAPGALTVVSNQGGTVTLQWSAPTGAVTSYVIEAGSTLGATNLANSDLGSAATTFTATRVGRGTYYVRIRARNACGVSSPSNEIVVVVP